MWWRSSKVTVPRSYCWEHARRAGSFALQRGLGTKRAQNGQSSHADAGSIGPSALSASDTVVRSDSLADRVNLPRAESTAGPNRLGEASDARGQQCFGGTAAAEAQRVGSG